MRSTYGSCPSTSAGGGSVPGEGALSGEGTVGDRGAFTLAAPVLRLKDDARPGPAGGMQGEDLRGTGRIAYAAAKGALHAMTVEMAYAHGRQGIRVNTVAPGHITTPLMFSNLGQTPETDFRQRMAAATTPLGTEGDGWDVGWAAAFPASDAARWITGVTLPVDGGVTAVTPLIMAPQLRAVIAPGDA